VRAGPADDTSARRIPVYRVRTGSAASPPDGAGTATGSPAAGPNRQIRRTWPRRSSAPFGRSREVTATGDAEPPRPPAGEGRAPLRSFPRARGARNLGHGAAAAARPGAGGAPPRPAGVGARPRGGVRALGMRRSRRVGLAKTGLHQVCIAGGMEVARIAHCLDGLPRARTRVARFAALAPRAA
jgi:hypothetical protein